MACDDLSTTAELPALKRPASGAADDTDQIDLSREQSPDDGRAHPHADQAHRYADGVIRFYRARTILLSDRDAKKFDRAWRYLEPLQPRGLPGTARRAFLELVYLIEEYEGSASSMADTFCEMVLAIAELIDVYLDETGHLGHGDDGTSAHS